MFPIIQERDVLNLSLDVGGEKYYPLIFNRKFLDMRTRYARDKFYIGKRAYINFHRPHLYPRISNSAIRKGATKQLFQLGMTNDRNIPYSIRSLVSRAKTESRISMIRINNPGFLTIHHNMIFLVEHGRVYLIGALALSEKYVKLIVEEVYDYMVRNYEKTSEDSFNKGMPFQDYIRFHMDNFGWDWALLPGNGKKAISKPVKDKFLVDYVLYLLSDPSYDAEFPSLGIPKISKSPRANCSLPGLFWALDEGGGNPSFRHYMASKWEVIQPLLTVILSEDVPSYLTDTDLEFVMQHNALPLLVPNEVLKNLILQPDKLLQDYAFNLAEKLQISVDEANSIITERAKNKARRVLGIPEVESILGNPNMFTTSTNIFTIV